MRKEIDEIAGTTMRIEKLLSDPDKHEPTKLTCPQCMRILNRQYPSASAYPHRLDDGCMQMV